VHMRADGDARFPAIDTKLWRETARSEHASGAEDEAAFAFVSYQRVSPVPPTGTLQAPGTV
jgi:dihydrofolate reductase